MRVCQKPPEGIVARAVKGWEWGSWTREAFTVPSTSKLLGSTLQVEILKNENNITVGSNDESNMYTLFKKGRSYKNIEIPIIHPYFHHPEKSTAIYILAYII